MLERLTTFVQWAGRYPVAVDSEQLTSGAGQYRAGDWKDVRELFWTIWDFRDRIPEIVWRTDEQDYCEVVKTGHNEWSLTMFSDGDPVQSETGASGLDLFRLGLDWRPRS